MSLPPLMAPMANVSLRFLSLAGKLLLTLYMGRYLSLSDMGLYGVVFSAVMILSVFLGGRLDYVVAREIVGRDQDEALGLMRDQAVFCVLNYAALGVVMLALLAGGVAGPQLLLAVGVLSVIENFANVTYTNLVALGHPLISTLLFFLRGGAWCLVVAGLGIWNPVLRTVDVVLIGWAVGTLASLAGTAWVWRRLPWGAALARPVDWKGIRAAAARSFPIWLGTLGAAGAMYLDRFVVSAVLDLEQVGVVTFYGSFCVALIALVQSGFFNFSQPRLIRFHAQGAVAAFWAETRQLAWQVGAFLALACVGVGVFVPWLAALFGKAGLAENAPTLWLMLLGVALRGNADTLHYVLYARHQDRAIWLGGVLFLVPSLAGNLLFVPLLGLEGVGISMIVSGFFLIGWRGIFARFPEKGHAGKIF